MFDNYTAIAAPLVATVALLAFLWALQQPRSRTLLGPAADGWEWLRGLVLPPLDRLARRRLPGQHYAAYTLSLDEVVGVIDAPPEAVERMIWERGATRMPLAALKRLPGGRTEVGSWAWRDGLLAREQVHVMLFAAKHGDRTVVAAHKEPNALNPLMALDHYRGRGLDADAGERAVRERLDEGVWVDG